MDKSSNNVMTKIEYIIGSLEIGGAERHLSQVLPVLQSMGFSVRILVLSDKAPLKPIFDKAGIEVNLGPNLDCISVLLFRKILRFLISLIRIILSFLKDRQIIRHTFLPEAYLFAAIAARLTFFSGFLIMSRRSLSNYQQRRPFLSKLERLMHRFTSKALGNSQAVVQQLYEEGFAKEKVDLIYNGIDLSAFQSLPTKQELRESLGLDQESLIFIIVANLIPYKGHADLLNALGKIHTQLPEKWNLLCVGYSAGIQNQLEMQANNLNIEQHVKFLGSRLDTPLLLGASDIGILCSHEEGFSNSILEAMAAGLPMVVTNVGGNAEAVGTMRTGFVVESKNPEALANSLLTLALSQDLREKFGKAGRKKVEKHFTLIQCAKAYADFYHSLKR